MSDAEIIEALDCLTGEPKLCKDCPYNNTERYPFCRASCAKDALDLINRQKAENERLQADIKTLESVIKRTFFEKAGFDIDPLAEIKAEAIKEFAEKLKEELRLRTGNNGGFVPGMIDNLVKEMAGDTE